MKRVAINGFGRIGRLVLRILMQYHRDEVEVAVVNGTTSTDNLAHLFKYDSIHRTYPGTVDYTEKSLIIDGWEIPIISDRDINNLHWSDFNVDLVYECTGKFKSRAENQIHINNGAKKVLLSVPAKDKMDATVVLGVNDETLKPEHVLVSNASCTTNCLAPIAKVLNDNFGIVHGHMTTVHSYTGDQRILDGTHKKDLRRARAAAMNIVPTSTGAAKGIVSCIPALDGKLAGKALRVPTPDGSLVDLTCWVEKDVTVEDINAAMKKASETTMKGILEYCTAPIVSSDIIGSDYSSIFDSQLTAVKGTHLVQVVGWYDNEWGYSRRLVELGIKMISF